MTLQSCKVTASFVLTTATTACDASCFISKNMTLGDSTSDAPKKGKHIVTPLVAAYNELSLKIGSKRSIMIVVILVGTQQARIHMIQGHVCYITYNAHDTRFPTDGQTLDTQHGTEE